MPRWTRRADHLSRREAELRHSVVTALAPLHAFAVENPVLPGTPDVNYVEGWLELKSWEKWPAQRTTPLRIEHWTPEQRVFHRRRSRVGGATYVLVEIVASRDYILLEGGLAARVLGKVPRASLERQALARWVGKPAMKAGLLALLRGRHYSSTLPHDRPSPVDDPGPAADDADLLAGP